MTADALAEAGNPITQKLAAISGLQPCGKRVIATENTDPLKVLTPQPEPAWSDERRARHRVLMKALWADPKKRSKMSATAARLMKKRNADPAFQAKRVAGMRASHAAKKAKGR